LNYTIGKQTLYMTNQVILQIMTNTCILKTCNKYTEKCIKTFKTQYTFHIYANVANFSDLVETSNMNL